MSARRHPGLVPLAVAALLVLTACGSRAEPVRPGAPDPDEPVSSTVVPGDDEPTEPVGTPVTPQPGTRDPRPHAWQRVDVGEDDRTLTVLYVGGVQDCYRLDRIEVFEAADSVTITVYEGQAPELPADTACIEIGVYKAVTVVLDAPLGDRELLDGAA